MKIFLASRNAGKLAEMRRILAQHLPDAQLVMYPDASHGAQSQHAGVFLEHARMFLNG